MKFFLLLIIVALGTLAPADASCDASILEGKHSASTKVEALAGAKEEAKELCYPGEVEFDEAKCNNSNKNAIADKKPTISCRQRVVCTLCGDALVRKVEAEVEHDDDH